MHLGLPAHLQIIGDKQQQHERVASCLAHIWIAYGWSVLPAGWHSLRPALQVQQLPQWKGGRLRRSRSWRRRQNQPCQILASVTHRSSCRCPCVCGCCSSCCTPRDASCAAAGHEGEGGNCSCSFRPHAGSHAGRGQCSTGTAQRRGWRGLHYAQDLSRHTKCQVSPPVTDRSGRNSNGDGICA